MSGFALTHRTVFDHPLFDGDAARLGAWLWLVGKACWKPTPFDNNGRIITLERGQICVSVRQLAERWGWSKSAVDRFLTRLETETMIERKAGQGKMVITICNYGKYQDLEDDERDSSGTASGTAAGQQRDIKEQDNKGTIDSPPKPPRGQGKTAMPEDWAAPPPADLPPQARKCAQQWPSETYARHAEAFHSYWRSNGKKMTDWRLTWANRVIAIHDQVMRNHEMSARYGQAPPGSSNPMVERILRERQQQ